MSFEEKNSNQLKVRGDLRFQLQEKMALDIEKLLSTYNNKDIGLRLISNKTSIGEKTLRRLMQKSSLPHQTTLVNFYNYFLSLHADTSEDEVNTFIKKITSNKSTPSKDELKYEELLANDKVFRDIYFFTRTGTMTRKQILDEYGNYGLEVMEQMIAHDLVRETEKHVYSDGPICFSKSPETIKKVILALIKDYHEPERAKMVDHNYAFYTIQNVNLETKKKLLELTHEYNKQTYNLLFNTEAVGDERIFVTNIVDELSLDNEKEEQNLTGKWQ